MRSASIRGYLVRTLLIGMCVIGAVPGNSAHAANVRMTRVVYAAFGDSLTTCDGVDDPSTQCYPALLAHYLPKGGKVVNVATVGATIGTALMQQLPDALIAHATVATIMVGAQDLTQGIDAPTYTAVLNRLLVKLKHAHVHVFIANINNFRYVPGVTNPQDFVKAGRAYNIAIAKLGASYDAPIVDIYAASKSLWGKPANVAADGVHLTPAGQRLLATVFYRVMHSHGAL